MDKITVIVPAYNVSAYLEKCVHSVITQTYKNLEIILVNDGSTDHTDVICDRLSRSDSRIKVIHQPNQGLSMARNNGMKLATGQFLTFIDSDDWMEEDMLEVLYNNLIANDADISICSYTFEKNDGSTPYKEDSTINVLGKYEALSELIINVNIKDYAWGKLYNTKLFENVDYPERTYFEDIYTTYKLFAKSDKIVVQNLPKYHYRIHAESITSKHTSSLKKELDYGKGLEALVNYLETHAKNFEAQHLKYLYYRMLRRIYGAKKQAIRILYHHDNRFHILNAFYNGLLRRVLPKVPIRLIGVLRYIGVLLSINYPAIFAKRQAVNYNKDFHNENS